MTLPEPIQEQLKHLPPEKQQKVLDFINFLRQRQATKPPAERRSLRQHPAFGSWHGRNIDALTYPHDLHAEWDTRP